MSICIGNQAKISIFNPDDARCFEKSLSRSAKITNEKFSGNSKQRRKQFRAKARRGLVSTWRKGKWIDLHKLLQ